MFKISPIQSINEQIDVASKCNSTYKSGAFAYVMRDSDSGALMGFSQFEINSKGGILLDLKPIPNLDDYEAMFILGRATMNFIDMCGKHTCYAKKDAGDEKLLRAIGFKSEKDDLLFCDMKGMFDGNCSSH